MLTLLEMEMSAEIAENQENRDVFRGFIEYKRQHSKFKQNIERIFKKNRRKYML